MLDPSQVRYGAKDIPLCTVLVQGDSGDGGSRVGRLPSRLPALVRTEIKGGLRRHVPPHAVHLSG